MNTGLVSVALRAFFSSLREVWPIAWRAFKEAARAIAVAVKNAASFTWGSIVYLQGRLANFIHLSFSTLSALSIVLLPLVALFDPFKLWTQLNSAIGDTAGVAIRLLMGALLLFISAWFIWMFFRTVKGKLTQTDEPVSVQEGSLSYTFASLLSWGIIFAFLGYFLVLRVAYTSETFRERVYGIGSWAEEVFVEPITRNTQEKKNVKDSSALADPELVSGKQFNLFFFGRTLSGGDGKFALATNEIEYGLLQEVSVGSTFELHTKECIYSGVPFGQTINYKKKTMSISARISLKQGSVGHECEVPTKFIISGSSTSLQMEWYGAKFNEPHIETFTTSYFARKT